MKILYIDTHKTKFFAIGYYNDNKLTIQNGTDASIEILSKIHKICKNQINKIIINTGPGSLTGLRIGSSIAQGIALGKNIEVLGLNLWQLIFNEYENIEFYFHTGTKQWIYKTNSIEYMTETPPNPQNKWISNKPELLNFNKETNIQFPNIIKLMHKNNKSANKNINIIYHPIQIKQ